MSTPYDHLPPRFPTETISSFITSLSLPTPTAIKRLKGRANFHLIYFITYDTTTTDLSTLPVNASTLSRDPDGSLTLVLRVSGNHIPRRKTANEVGVLQWVRRNTRVPVPAVVLFDCTENNALGREFTLLERVPGRCVDEFYDELDEVAKLRLIEQLTNFTLELNAHDWSHIGGLQPSDVNGVMSPPVPGPVMEESFWLVPDIERYWGPGESNDTLNPGGPYVSHEEYVRAYLGIFIRAINTHESLAWLRTTLAPRLETLKSMHIPQLSTSRLVLAHKALHFVNIMAADDGTVTGILDWEFAGVVPALRWDPSRTFLWNGRFDEASQAEKIRMRTLFADELERKDIEPWMVELPEVHLVWNVLNFTRALTVACPRGELMTAAEGWRDSALGFLAELGIS